MGDISKSSLYKIVDRSFPVPGFADLFQTTKKMEPVGTGLIDVVNTFKWKNLVFIRSCLVIFSPN